MKRAFAYILIVSILAGPAAGPAYCGGPVEKLGRGISNTLTFPCEIPYQIRQTNRQNGFMAAISYGILNGAFMAGARALVGIYEIVTFPVPIPGDFGPILADPEFFFNTSWK